jgi:hypothetical protein
VAKAFRKAKLGIGRLGWWLVASVFPSVGVGLAACAYGPQVAYGPPPTCTSTAECTQEHGPDWYCDFGGGGGDPAAGDADHPGGDPRGTGYCRQFP